ncbi:MAG: glycosyltransferase [Acidimicrobiia bacterium]|nr:glycosyltransferase [Acidimicrobiia bacterium]
MPTVDPSETTVCVYICTYRRNDSLVRLLDSLEVAAGHAAGLGRLGVVVVDDNADRSAEPVVTESTHVFSLGLHYRWTGAGNIATARNAGVAAAMELADWVAMVDDDQIVVPEWLTELLRVQAEHQADAVTAPVYARFADDAPAWLLSQPFADLWCTPARPDGSPVTDLQTANSLISTRFLRDHPAVRFSPDLGSAGGEDMVFYRAALDAGLKAHYSHHAVSWELEPAERATYRYQLRRNLWHGNTEAITCLRAGRDGRLRLVARAAKRGVVALSHPARQLLKRRPPQFRYAAAYSLQPVGLVLGASGVVLRHG